MHHEGPAPVVPLVLLVRHAATAWSEAGRHTGRTDIELNEAGRDQSLRLASTIERLLHGRGEPVVFSSTLARARQTAELAMPRVHVHETDLVVEIDYGAYEGLTSAEIAEREPGWSVFAAGGPGGESIAAVTARCESFVAKVERMAAGRPVVVFTHGHTSRALTCRLLGLPVSAAAALHSEPASVGVVEARRGTLVLTGWNLRAT